MRLPKKTRQHQRCAWRVTEEMSASWLVRGCAKLVPVCHPPCFVSILPHFLPHRTVTRTGAHTRTHPHTHTHGCQWLSCVRVLLCGMALRLAQGGHQLCLICVCACTCVCVCVWYRQTQTNSFCCCPAVERGRETIGALKVNLPQHTWWGVAGVCVGDGGALGGGVLEWAGQRRERTASRTGSRRDVWVSIHLGVGLCVCVSVCVTANTIPIVSLSSRSWVHSSTVCTTTTSLSRSCSPQAWPSSRWSRSPSSSMLLRSMGSPRLTCFKPLTSGRVSHSWFLSPSLGPGTVPGCALCSCDADLVCLSVSLCVCRKGPGCSPEDPDGSGQSGCHQGRRPLPRWPQLVPQVSPGSCLDWNAPSHWDMSWHKNWA